MHRMHRRKVLKKLDRVGGIKREEKSYGPKEKRRQGENVFFLLKNIYIFKE